MQGSHRLDIATFPNAHACGAPTRRGAGFTVAEMVVVVAIVALLVTLLFPTLNAARRYARQAQCSSNLKQIRYTMFPGATSSRDIFPDASGWTAMVINAGAGAALDCPDDNVGKPVVSGNAIEVTGDVKVVDVPPRSVKFGAMESSDHIFVFKEQEDFIPRGRVQLNMAEPGEYGKGAVLSRSGAYVPIGEPVDVYYISFDPVGSERAVASGSLTLPGEIIGIIADDAELHRSDRTLGRDDVVYPTGQSNRGFESGKERLTVDADRRTVTIHEFHSTHPGENVRIVTRSAAHASYGFNNQVTVKTIASGQLMMMGYEKPTIDLDMKGAGDDDYNAYFAERHFKKNNVMMVDGSILLMDRADLGPRDRLWNPRHR